VRTGHLIDVRAHDRDAAGERDRRHAPLRLAGTPDSDARSGDQDPTDGPAVVWQTVETALDDVLVSVPAERGPASGETAPGAP
jgi:hypothetical protein